jgi:SAM-dependent methyltransferase
MDSAYWDAKFAVDEYVYTKVENRFVKEFCSDLNPGKAIDLAGGEGRNTVWLATLGWQVENIDISPAGLAKSRRLAQEFQVAERCFETVGSGLDFESQLAPVDLVVVAYLQIPQPELYQSLRRAVENLKPTGKLVGVWHSRNNLTEGFGGPQNPEVLPTIDELRMALASTPITIETLEIRDGQVQTQNGLKPSKTLVLVATKNA